MRVITANVNGIRACARRGGVRWLADQQADVLCLQEVRATDSADLAAARGTAAEIAAGHSLTRFAVLVTATVAGPEQLAAARTAIEQSSASSRILLRRCHGAQSAAFAAGLGLGMHLASWVSTPDFVREKL